MMILKNKNQNFNVLFKWVTLKFKSMFGIVKFNILKVLCHKK